MWKVMLQLLYFSSHWCFLCDKTEGLELLISGNNWNAVRVQRSHRLFILWRVNIRNFITQECIWVPSTQNGLMPTAGNSLLQLLQAIFKGLGWILPLKKHWFSNISVHDCNFVLSFLPLESYFLLKSSCFCYLNLDCSRRWKILFLCSKWGNVR